MNGTRFAIITDTHIRVPGGDLSSPFPVNEKANPRAVFAVGMIAAAKPDFTIHLGDVIHPLPHMPSAVEAAVEAERILAPLKPDLHFVPGNHDIGDKPSDLMPAGPVDQASIAVYEKRVGPQFHAFRHRDVHLVCMNSSLVNTGSEPEKIQRDWLEQELRGSDAAVKLLFSHYPPFICTADEADHYDNYGEPGRSWLLNLAAETGVRSIFSGHVHHFFYNRYRDVQLYCLPATSFTRQDYAELFPISPANEFGRDDLGKFGVTIIEASEQGVDVTVHNTVGAEGAFTGPPPSPPKAQDVIPHLRHAWHVPKALPYNGPMEEFSRKLSRNDYPLLRLMQLGIDTVRVPAADLLDPAARGRIEDWIALGHKILPFWAGSAADDVIRACEELRDSMPAVEVLVRKPEPGCLRGWGDLPIWLSKISTSADDPDPAQTFAHAVGSGVFPERTADLAKVAAEAGAAGIVMQIAWERDLAAAVRLGQAAVESTDLLLILNLCLRLADPAKSNFDQAAIDKRIATARDLAAADCRIVLQIDTFEDVDRGYGPRFGLIDRLSNLRP
ncbi:MAG: metallophosphoesterase family protein [Geminicoccaceae bacterium]